MQIIFDIKKSIFDMIAAPFRGVIFYLNTTTDR